MTPDPNPANLVQAQELAARLPPLLVAAQRVAASLTSGSHGRRRAGPGETFWQYRRAIPGDAAAAIDWRRSARGPGLYVRESEWAASQGIWLWADASGSMDWRSLAQLPTKAERARLLALALAAGLLNGGERVALLQDGTLPASGPGILPRLAAALLSPPPHGGLPRPHRPPRHGEIVLISDFLHPADSIAAEIAALAAQGAGGHLLQVMDPAEETLPYAGPVRFTGLEGEAEITSRRAEDWRQAYRDKLQAHRDAVAASATAHGWSFAVHHTDQPPQHALLGLYSRLSLPRSGISTLPRSGMGGGLGR
ncbi:MAG: hypothetical protein FD176_87 [Rhodospirillaceae bacterium]|nr:MAG: hypothetical protein FD176_87 [Rhodospirillaceae bacterium]TNC94871.1 MAG: hypothetical protein FD119_2920 [Stygiobacter sp.]